MYSLLPTGSYVGHEIVLLSSIKLNMPLFAPPYIFCTLRLQKWTGIEKMFNACKHTKTKATNNNF